MEIRPLRPQPAAVRWPWRVASAVPTGITVFGNPELGNARRAPTTLTASVSSSTAGSITGAVTFTMGSTTLGTASVSGGTATLSNVAATAAKRFHNWFRHDLRLLQRKCDLCIFVWERFSDRSGSARAKCDLVHPCRQFDNAHGQLISHADTDLNQLCGNGYANANRYLNRCPPTSNVTASLGPTSVTLTSNGAGTSTLTVSANSSASKRAPAVPWKCGVGSVWRRAAWRAIQASKKAGDNRAVDGADRSRRLVS